MKCSSLRLVGCRLSRLILINNNKGPFDLNVGSSFSNTFPSRQVFNLDFFLHFYNCYTVHIYHHLSSDGESSITTTSIIFAIIPGEKKNLARQRLAAVGEDSSSGVRLTARPCGPDTRLDHNRSKSVIRQPLFST